MYESVAAVIRDRAAAGPGAIAITGDGRPVTFGELDERSSRLATGGVQTFVGEFAPDAGSRSLVPPPYYHIAASGWSLTERRRS